MRSYSLPLHENLLNIQVLAQIHRWFQFYERGGQNVENQLSLLTDKVRIKTTIDESIGHKAYCDRLAKLPSHWKNAHHIKQIDLYQNNDKTISLNLDVIYQNIGYLPSSQLMNLWLKYRTNLAIDSGTGLPQFLNIQTERCEVIVPPDYHEFIDTYPQHRIRSLIYYFISLFDSGLPDASLFKEILMPKIDIQLTSEYCSSFDQFNKWFQSRRAQMLQSRHCLESLVINPINNDSYKVSLEFSWTGVARNQPDKELKARTIHHWMVIDNSSESFARIQTMKVKSIPCELVSA